MIEALRPHRLWIGLLALAIVLACGSGPLIGLAQKKQTERLAVLNSDYDKTAAALRQLQEDIAATERLRTQIGDGEAEKSLAPVDRLRAAHVLEKRAAQSRLTGFTYTFAPEQAVTVDSIDAGPQKLALSRLTIGAEAPTDLDAYIFLDAMMRALPGRVALRQVTLERIGAADAPVAATNLRLTAQADWLSNGAAQNLAEGGR